jgi:hypothetical protein
MPKIQGIRKTQKPRKKTQKSNYPYLFLEKPELLPTLKAMLTGPQPKGDRQITDVYYKFSRFCYERAALNSLKGRPWLF